MFFSNKLKALFPVMGRVATLLVVLLTSYLPVWAKGAAGPPPVSSLENPLALTLIIMIAVLAIVVVLLAWVVNGAADVFITKYKKERAGAGSAAMLLVLLSLLAPPAMAQDAAETGAAVSTTIGGLDKTTFYFLTGVLFLEVIAILYMLYNLQLLIRAEKVKSTEEIAAAARAPKENWWTKLNKFRPVEQEADIDLGHDYDGIRELDNKLPPWWLYGFYLCIIFAVVYLWRFHVSHTGPSSKEEFQIAMAKADKEKEEFLKKSASNVDENTVVMLDASGIAAGQATYITNCAACHGKLGEGTVGPNLTDDYWLHGGKINDIFKTIKYGVPEKGMRAWQEDLSPVKIAQVASFIKSIHGTNPPNPKEKQGEPYTEEAAPAAKPAADSASTAPGDSAMVTKAAQ